MDVEDQKKYDHISVLFDLRLCVNDFYKITINLGLPYLYTYYLQYYNKRFFNASSLKKLYFIAP